MLTSDEEWAEQECLMYRCRECGGDKLMEEAICKKCRQLRKKAKDKPPVCIN